MGASTSGIRAGKAYVELTANDSKLQKGLKSAASRLKLWGATMTAAGTKVSILGGAIVAPMMLAAKAFASSGDDLAEMSARTGASVESLSTLGFAAMKTGVDMTSLETGVKKMQKTLFQAATGSKSANTSLAMLGLTIADLQGLSPDKQFELLGDRISRIEDPAMKAGIAMQIFGRAGTAMIPMMEGGAAAFQRYRDRLAELGGPTTTASAEAGHKLSQTLEDLHFATGRATKSIGAALAPTIGKFTDDIIRITVSATKWIKANQDTVAGLFQLGKYLVVIGGALAVTGYALKLAATGLLILKGAATASVLAFKVLAALAVSPWALVAVGAVAAAVAVTAFTDQGKKGLSEMADTAGTVADAMIAAFGRGDITLAMQVLGAGINLEWQKIIGKITWAWNTLCDNIAKGIYGWMVLFDDAKMDNWVGSQAADLEEYAKGLKDAEAKLAAFQKKALKPVTGAAAVAAPAAAMATAIAPAMAFGDSQGTFTTTNMLRMGAMGMNDRLLAATEKVADNTEKIAENTEDSGDEGMGE